MRFSSDLLTVRPAIPVSSPPASLRQTPDIQTPDLQTAERLAARGHDWTAWFRVHRTGAVLLSKRSIAGRAVTSAAVMFKHFLKSVTMSKIDKETDHGLREEMPYFTLHSREPWPPSQGTEGTRVG